VGARVAAGVAVGHPAAVGGAHVAAGTGVPAIAGLGDPVSRSLLRQKGEGQAGSQDRAEQILLHGKPPLGLHCTLLFPSLTGRRGSCELARALASLSVGAAYFAGPRRYNKTAGEFPIPPSPLWGRGEKSATDRRTARVAFTHASAGGAAGPRRARRPRRRHRRGGFPPRGAAGAVGDPPPPPPAPPRPRRAARRAAPPPPPPC